MSSDKPDGQHTGHAFANDSEGSNGPVTAAPEGAAITSAKQVGNDASGTTTSRTFTDTAPKPHTDTPAAPIAPAVAEQLTFAGFDDLAAEVARPQPKRRSRTAGPVAIAEQLPVARVVLDLAPAHLDRTFDYLVPATMADAAQPGTRINVRFAGRTVDGFIVERLTESDHDGQLLPLRRVVSSEQVLTPQVAALARAVADHYAGTLSDVLRLAVPPRHARTEAAVAPAYEGLAITVPGVQGNSQTTPTERAPSVWAAYPGGGAFLSHLARAHSPRAVWTALPGTVPSLPESTAHPHWAVAITQAALATRLSGRGVLVVVPDARDVDTLCAALAAATNEPVARLMADEGPVTRYAAFLAVLRGHARIVVGTRAAAFAPVRDLGLVVCWSDGEDTHSEPRAPYPHTRQVLAIRADLENAAFLVGSISRTTAAQAICESGWAKELIAPRAVVREHAPRVRALTSTELASEGAAAAARIPAPAFRAARQALEHGPVLVQVPRAGYAPVVACTRCHAIAACATCHGPLAITGPGVAPQCSWCGALAGNWTCPECSGHGLRMVRVGSARTGEELRPAFKGVRVRMSGASAPSGVLATVPETPALIVATPGAEPIATGGYAAALLLDAAVSTAHTGLHAHEEALARWMAAAALVRPGGQVLLIGDAAPGPTNALVRWDPAGFAARELAERRELDLPPAVRVAAVTGDRTAVAAVVGRIELATPDNTLGPVEVPDDDTLTGAVRTLIRVPLKDGRHLARELAASLSIRAARREPATVKVQLDPKDLL